MLRRLRPCDPRAALADAKPLRTRWPALTAAGNSPSGGEGPRFESRLAYRLTSRTLGPFSRNGAPMIFGMSIATFTLLHTVLSLFGIVAGLVTAAVYYPGSPLVPLRRTTPFLPRCCPVAPTALFT